MYYRRKAYKDLLRWKKAFADKYAILIEGARRVGKSTLAEEFAKNEYGAYIKIDFANVSKTIRDCFDDIDNLDMFFLRLQAASGVQLIKGNSVILLDEIQLFPKARQAIKYLVADGRYHYIETGSLISIKKNVKDIVIPSEEKKLALHPFDYEEFLEATGSEAYDLIKQSYEKRQPLGQSVNRKLMRDFRLYMAVGGMPQAVSAYCEGLSFSEIDGIKREIIRLYDDDFKKIDSSGRISSIFRGIPAQLSRGSKRYLISKATGGRKRDKDDERLYDLIDSKTVIVAYHLTDPRVSLSLTKDKKNYKLYLADTGLFVTLLYMDRPSAENEIYTKLLSDKLSANLGYLYENAVAQVIASANRGLFYHTWQKKNSTHYYEIDFLVSKGTKVIPIEVKSSGTGKHESITEFARKYKGSADKAYIISQKDIGSEGRIKNLPVYMTPCFVDLAQKM